MLLAHLVPHHIIICQASPALADLGCLAQGCRVEITKDLEGYLGRESGDEVDSNEISDGGRDEGELGEAALCEDTAKHQLSLFRRSSGEQGPHVGNALLIGLCKGLQLLVKVRDIRKSARSPVENTALLTLCNWSIDGSSACRLHFESGLCR